MYDEDSVSTLAYSKSPKFSKRTTFQEELQEALSARAARQQTAEYSEDFESDDEGSEKYSETLENTSKKSVAFATPLSKKSHYSGSSLKSESEDALSLSDADETPHYVSELEREILREEREAVPFSLIEYSRSYEENIEKTSIPFDRPLQDCHSFEKDTSDVFTLGEDEERTWETSGLENEHMSEEIQDLVSEGGSGFELEGEQQYGEHTFELQLERDNMIKQKHEIKPVPKPREFKNKAASVSAENISIPTFHEYSKPSPQPRSVLRKSSHVEDHEGSKTEDRTSHNHRFFSLSAPSSETRLNDQVMKSERRALAESPSPEVRNGYKAIQYEQRGPWIASSSSPFPIHFSSMDERTGDSNLKIFGEELSSKDDEEKGTGNSSDLKLLESGRKSPSVLELMMTTVYEKTKKLQKSVEDDFEQKLETIEHSAIKDRSKETTKDDKSEQKVDLSPLKAALEVSEDSVKERSEFKQRVSQNVKSQVSRSLSSAHLKKTGKPCNIPTSTSSQYLGTLKFLDNKHLRKYSAELDKADSLRAAVYQEWLEKKRVFLVELQRIKRNKAENLREKNEKKEAAKKEEALASFEAWKAMKEKEAKKLAEKKRLEEAKKRKEAELNEKKKEEAQKAAFEKWKEKKAEYSKQQLKKERRIERLKKKKEEEIVAEKKKDSRSAVEKWNEKKEEYLKQKKKEKTQERKKEVDQEVEMQERDKKAIEAYEKWLGEPLQPSHVSAAQNQQSIAGAQGKKEVKEMMQRTQKKLQVILEDETPPPWSPPGKAVPSRSY
ncbi:microtubule-associated protein 9 isoform X1 [Anolis carolinensis]|uniref:microtubule-associated protein 9 isoform X1 n=1 Tax=Anolis carolinensis TaxID=28377 RepID=UPI002F2B7154